MSREFELADVSLPPNASKSREVDAGFTHDQQAQHSGALQLAYSMHGAKCKVCREAEGEAELCSVGQEVYSQMRTAGLVS